MIVPLFTALLVLASGQVDATSERRPGESEEPPLEDTQPPEVARTLTDSSEVTGPAGVPFVPTVGSPAGRTRGVFLDLAVLSELRTRTLSDAGGSTIWGTDVEVTPGIALDIGTTDLTLSIGYAPRLSVPFNVGSFELAVLNRATLNAEWRVDPLWTVTGLGIFVVGDYSQLIPASTPGGAGPPPPILNPVRSFQTYPYVGIDTQLRLDGVLSRRTRVRVAGGYFDVGGTGPVGEANQPRSWGPQAEGAFAWDASQEATFTTTAAGQDWIMSGDYSILIGTFTEAWRQAWSSEFDTTASLGAGIANRDVESSTAANHVMPVAGLKLDYHPQSRREVHLTLDAALAPYVDTYLRIPYQRLTAGIGLDWRPSDAWRVGANLAAALAPSSVRAPDSYGVAGASASYAPVPFLVFTVGGFSQVVFQGATTVTGTFRQWSAYFSVALRDRLSL